LGGTMNCTNRGEEKFDHHAKEKMARSSTTAATVSPYAVAMMCKNPSLRVCREEVCAARKEKVCTFPPNMSRLLRQERPARRR